MSFIFRMWFSRFWALHVLSSWFHSAARLWNVRCCGRSPAQWNPLVPGGHFHQLSHRLCEPFLHSTYARGANLLHVPVNDNTLHLQHQALLPCVAHSAKAADIRAERHSITHFSTLSIQRSVVSNAHLLPQFHELCWDRTYECPLHGWSHDILVERIGWL